MPVYLTYAIQLLLVIHVLKTGRDKYWIWLLIFLPAVGGIAYFVIEILPELQGGIHGQRAMRKARGVLDPGGDVRQAAAAYEQSANAENARHYALALLSGNRNEEAEEVLEAQLRGIHEHDPLLLELKARAQFGQEKYNDAIWTMDKLTEENPDHTSAEGHLLYARALEAVNRTDDALDNYHAVSDYYPGAEARVRYCLALIANGQSEEGRQALEELLNDAKLAPRHFRQSQKPWLEQAKAALKGLETTTLH
jgi:hypothetical protein